jgi:hypothetical protein
MKNENELEILTGELFTQEKKQSVDFFLQESVDLLSYMNAELCAPVDLLSRLKEKKLKDVSCAKNVTPEKKIERMSTILFRRSNVFISSI